MTSFFPREVFDGLVKEWSRAVRSASFRVSAAAALKDVLTLLQSRPREMKCFLQSENTADESLRCSCEEAIQYLQDILVPLLRSAVSKRLVKRTREGEELLVSSPLAGGIPIALLSSSQTDDVSATKLDGINIGSINPGSHITFLHSLSDWPTRLFICTIR